MNQNRTSIESDDAQSDVKLRHGTLSGMQSLGNGVYEISISLGSEFRFVAGEYVWIVLDELSTAKELDRRAFSISSADGAVNEIKIILRESESLFKKNLLSKKIGSKLKIYGPHGGAYFAPKGHTKEYVLLSGGVGIAPFLSLIRSAIKSGDDSTHFTLLHYKNPNDQIYDDELIDINSGHKNIKIKSYDQYISTKHLSNHINKQAKYFICGPKDFVKKSYELLTLHDVERGDMAFEQYYPEDDNHDEILELANYVNEVARAKDLGVTLKEQTSFYNKIRRTYFVYLLGLSIIGLIALLIFEKYYDNVPFTDSENLVWWGFLLVQVSNTLFYLKYKKYVVSVLISINALALTMIVFMSVDPHSSLEKAWLMLPIALTLFFVSRKIAIINVLIYSGILATIVGSLTYLNVDTYWSNNSPIYWLLFGLNSLAALLLFFAVSKLISRSEHEMNNRVSAFDTLVRAVDNSSSHTIITDSNGVILYGNEAASVNTGFSTSDMVGQTPRLWGGLASLEYYKNLWAIKRIQVINNEEIVNRNKKGDAYTVNAHISMIKNKYNKLIGYIASEENITQLKNTERSLSFAKDRIENIIKGTELGTWEWNVQTGETIFNERWANIIGYKLSELQPVSIKTWEKFAHPDDLKASEEELQKHFKGEKDFYEFKSRMRHKNGQWIWVLDRGKVMSWTADKKPLWMYGSHLDITEEHEIDQAKSEFVSLASHQLRTPLSSINWYSELLLGGDTGKLNKQQYEYISEVDRANTRMVDLINSLLNVSRLELGTFVLEAEDLNLKDCSEQIIKEIKIKSDEKKQQLNVVFKQDTPNIIFDKKYLEMLYQNLLSNAVKYTPEKGKIDLIVEPVKSGDVVDGYKIPKSGVVITVADNGYGIPKNQQGQIMTKLFRADNALDKDADGTGLGLYIIKSVIDHSNGNLWFKSIEDKGTTFHAYLPLETVKKEGSKKLS